VKWGDEKTEREDGDDDGKGRQAHVTLREEVLLTHFDRLHPRTSDHYGPLTGHLAAGPAPGTQNISALAFEMISAEVNSGRAERAT
jgi:hypothetical protein